jgi:C4-dicarboxylate transporter, DctM subunit
VTNFQIGLAGIGVLLILLACRFPIAIALTAVSLGGIYSIRGFKAGTGSLGVLPFEISANWTLSAIPMFLLMGVFAFNSGMTASVFQVCRMWFGWVPGGLAIATNWSSAMFGAISGSSLAVTAVMAKVAIPEMLKSRYDKSLASSVVAASGTIDSLIPPSLAFVIYSWYAEVPLTRLFLAGIVPGLLTGLLYTVMIVGRVMHNPSLAPADERTFTAVEKRTALLDAWPLPLLFAGIFFGLYSGIMTPTEAAAVSAGLAFLISVMRRQMTWRILTDSLRDTALTTASIFFIVIGAGFFTRFMAVSGFPHYIGNLIQQNSPSQFAFMLMLSGVLVVLGIFLEGISIMILTLPILVPICKSLGIDLIWVGVLVVKLIMVGLLHPPLGIQAFVVKGVVGDEIPLTTIFRGLLWFLGVEVLIIALLIAFPELSTGLPNLLLG